MFIRPRFVGDSHLTLGDSYLHLKHRDGRCNGGDCSLRTGFKDCMLAKSMLQVA